MELNDYQQQAARTLLQGDNDPSYGVMKLGTAFVSRGEVYLAWNALGLAGEAGEVADSIKKAVFHGRGVDQEYLKKELGDVMWYVAAIASCLGLTLDQVACTNIEKLKARYPEGWDASRSHRPGETAIEDPPLAEGFGHGIQKP